jgi:uncharacterized protein YicC (UPF0701 family)
MRVARNLQPVTPRGSNRAARSASLAALALALAAAGCGRRATAEDCALIVDRNVEVELQAMKVTDPAVIQRHKAELRRDLKDKLDTCPGKRITDAMLTCVRQAQTSEELDRCTRW